MVSVIKADTSFIPVIKKLACETWPVTYNEIISATQINYMLHLFYNESALQKQMKDGHLFIIAIDDTEASGFASYSPKEHNSTVYKLHKIYVHPGQQGKSIGKILLNHIISDAQTKGVTALELNVNRLNKALGFYQKNGFEIIQEEDVDIGNGYFMNDYTMLKKL